VNVAGQPAKVGGRVAGVLGKVVLLTGLLVALVLGGLANAISVGAGPWVGGIMAVITLLVSLPLILGGRKLRRTGEGQIQAAREHAVFSLAAQRRGVLTVREVARAVSIREEEADALLTALAKRPDSGVTLDVDDNGGLSYRFTDLLPTAGARVRVADEPWAAPRRIPVPPAPPRIIDAELIEDEVLTGPAQHRASR
jgi:hypothetical protein